VAEVFTGVGLTVRRGDRLLLDDLSWSVSEGERWVVIGPNGAGKTTLLSILAGRMFPTSGLIEVLGEELGATDMAELRTRIGWASSGELIDLARRQWLAGGSRSMTPQTRLAVTNCLPHGISLISRTERLAPSRRGSASVV
jgi:GTPase SAR1 family protein